MPGSAAADNDSKSIPTPARSRVARGAALLVLVAALLALRNPGVVASPRFWAEEADLLYASAWFLPGLDALWQNTALRSGYLNVFPVVSTWLAAKLVEPELAPAVALVSIGLVQGAVLALALAGARKTLATPFQRAVVAAIVLYFPYHNGLAETWLSVMNASVHFGVGALLLLLADERGETRGWRALSRALLVVGSITGPYMFVLAPLFVLKWWIERGRESLVRASIVSGLAAIQGALALSVLLGGGPTDTRELASFEPARPYVSLVFQFVYPVTGEIPGRLLLAGLGALPESSDLGWARVGAALVVIGAVACLAWATSPRTSARTLLVLAASIWFVFTTLFAVNGLAAYRYAVCPAVAFGLLLASAATSMRGPRAARTLAVSLLVAAIAGGVVESWLLQGPMTGLHQASWRDEVVKWRADPDHALRAWPSSVWFTHLAEPGRAAALRASVAAAPATIRLDGPARLPLDRSGLPAYFALRFEACAKAPSSLRIAGIDARGDTMFRDDRTIAAGCAVEEINSMDLAFAGFARHGRVVAIVFALAEPSDVELGDFRVATPVLGVDHPMSGD